MNILFLFISILISAALAGYTVYIILRPRLQAAQKLDAQTEKQNGEIQTRNEILIGQNNDLLEKNCQLRETTSQLKLENDKLLLQKNSTQEQIDSLNHSLQAMEKQACEAAELFFKSKMEVAQENLAQSLEIEAQKYQENVKSFKTQYDETVAEIMKEYKTLEENVSQMKATNDAAVAAAKRAEELKDQQDYYRIQLSAADIHEIELLRSVEPYLRDKEPLNKVIWKCYYEKPTTDMIGRVIGSGIHTGIYKITEIATGKCYVGQAANLSDRWKQHIKRGVGADAPTRNKLYPAMIAAGPENFTFEVIEECNRTLLDDREKYWTDYFKAQEFGFSIRKG